VKHQVAGRRFDMPTDQRRALFRNLTTQVLKHGSVRTTEARAKEVRPLVERMITLGKRGSLHARRQALAYVYEPDVVEKLFGEIAPGFASRPGGYTRLSRIGPRKGDGAMMVQIELVS
jgi:large subunit ribosomal protein L17